MLILYADYKKLLCVGRANVESPGCDPGQQQQRSNQRGHPRLLPGPPVLSRIRAGSLQSGNQLFTFEGLSVRHFDQFYSFFNFFQINFSERTSSTISSVFRQAVEHFVGALQLQKRGLGPTAERSMSESIWQSWHIRLK